MKQQTLCLALVIAGCCAAPVAAQPRSSFNLNKVYTRLTDGTMIKGRILDATPDSLVMEAKSVSLGNPYTPGNEITFRLRGVPTEYSGTVLDATDSVIYVRLDVIPKENSSFYKRFVSSVKVTRAAYREPGPQWTRVAFHHSQIENIQLHRKGAGVAGFIVGGLLGIVVTGVIMTPYMFKEPDNAVVVFASGVLIVSPFIGMGLATTGKIRQVNGDPVKYEAFVGKVFPGVKRKP